MKKSNNKRLLIVEDEPSELRALRDKFTHEGFTVLEAINGEEGLKMALEERPDLILLDIVMPKMDGMTMLAHLRKNSWGKKAQVILLTNLSDDEKVQEAVRLGSYEFLIKSNWKIEDVVAEVKGKLNM